jgi:parallel beta-helix repeat protein
MRIAPALLISFCAMPLLAQGPLTPPAGMPAPTMKTLDQVEPRTPLRDGAPGVSTDAASHFIINEPGSYYLTGTLAATKSNAIVINSQGVTLDLSGFEIRHTSTGDIGVRVEPAGNRATIRNGSIRGFGAGVALVGDAPTAVAGKVIDVAVNNCTNFGIQVGHSWLVENCQAHGNGIGFSIGSGSTLTKSTATRNAQTGVAADTGVTITDCTAYDNLGGGFQLGEGSTITNSAARQNTGTGIRGFGSNAISKCTVQLNGGTGIHVGNDSNVSHCSVVQNSAGGIRAEDGAAISHCTVARNTGNGIDVGSDSSVSDCTVRFNVSSSSSSWGIAGGGASAVKRCMVSLTSSTAGTFTPTTGGGISLGNGAKVTDCNVTENRGDGIRVGSDSVVANNNCDSNGIASGDGAGITVVGSDTRVDNNNVTDNDRGIHMTGAGNVIVRNTASGNTTNYQIAAGNTDAQVITPGAAFTTANPWANISY